MRTNKQVITAFFHALDDIEFVGFSCEPIPTAMDPDDELDGDTVCHVSIGRATTNGKFFCSPMRITFPMEQMREMDDARFARNLESFAEAVSDFAQRPIEKTDVIIGTSPGISSLSKMIDEAEKQAHGQKKQHRSRRSH